MAENVMVIGLDEAIAHLQDAGGVVKAELRTAMQQSVEAIRAEAAHYPATGTVAAGRANASGSGEVNTAGGSGLFYSRTGTLGRSIVSQVTVGLDEVRGQVGTAEPYARYVEEGTGVYGPKHAPIVANSGGFLRIPVQTAAGKAYFGLKGKQAAIYRRSVLGSYPWHYMENAVKATQPKVTEYFRAAAKRIALRLVGAK